MVVSVVGAVRHVPMTQALPVPHAGVHVFGSPALPPLPPVTAPDAPPVPALTPPVLAPPLLAPAAFIAPPPDTVPVWPVTGTTPVPLELLQPAPKTKNRAENPRC